MKNIIFICGILTMCIGQAWSQSEITIEYKSHREKRKDEVKTLFGGNKHGVYYAIGGAYTKIDNLDGSAINTRLMYVNNREFGFGFGGSAFASQTMDNPKIGTTNNVYNLAGAYAGIILEPVFGSKRKVHVSLPLFFGAGGLVYVEDYDIYYEPNNTLFNMGNGSYHGNGMTSDFPEALSPFLIFEPGIELEFNLLKHLRLALVTSYKLTTDIEFNYGVDNVSVLNHRNPLNGFSFGANFKFGKF